MTIASATVDQFVRCARLLCPRSFGLQTGSPTDFAGLCLRPLPANAWRQASMLCGRSSSSTSIAQSMASRSLALYLPLPVSTGWDQVNLPFALGSAPGNRIG